MPDDTPTLTELRERKEAADRDLAAAEAAEAGRPAISQAEVDAIVAPALAAHAAAKTHQERHDAVQPALAQLEAGKHKGCAVDLLAQHVIDAREAMAKESA